MQCLGMLFALSFADSYAIVGEWTFYLRLLTKPEY